MEAIFRILDRVERLPEWLRPVAYGPVLIGTMMVAKGALRVGPIVAAVALWQSDDRWGAVSTACGVLAIVFGASAAGGLAYSLVGKTVKRRLPLGWLPAGWIAVLPYMAGLLFVIRIVHGTPLLDPWTSVDWITVGIMTLIFGSQFGYMWLGPDAAGF